jgi:hypothetical protein
LDGLRVEGNPGKMRRKGPHTKRELIIAVWSHLGRPAIGEKQLRAVQGAIRAQLGAGALASPAAIARVLADEGAELRHPEVIEFDARWRELQIKSTDKEVDGLDNLSSEKPLRLKQAESFIKKLEKLRQRAERAGEQQALRRLRDVAISAKQAAQSLAGTRALAEPVRAEQAEIAQWLGVWIQTPNLFAEWLELRRRSPEFRKRFAIKKDRLVHSSSIG